MRVLIIEDEPYMAEAIEQVLKKEYSVDLALDGAIGLDCALMGIYDVLIIDVMLPSVDGFTIVKELRQNAISTPVIMLTARNSMDDKVYGLNSGADDYLVKPFQMEELMARLRALTRRQPLLKEHTTNTYEDIVLDVPTLTLICHQEMMNLTLKESQVLELLLLHQKQIVSKAMIIEKVWGYESEVEDNHVEVYISFIRKKLVLLNSVVVIETIRGLGYKLGSKR